jgi:hypothetical protein
VPLEPESDIEDALAVMRRSGGHVGRTVGTDDETLGVDIDYWPGQYLRARWS